MMVYQAADQEIVRQVEAWKVEREELEALLASTLRDSERFEAVQAVKPMLAAGIEAHDNREIATLLQNAGVRVWVEDGEVVLVELA